MESVNSLLHKLLMSDELPSEIADEKAGGLCLQALRLARVIKKGQLSRVEKERAFSSFREDCDWIVGRVRKLLTEYKQIPDSERFHYFDKYENLVNELLEWLTEVVNGKNADLPRWQRLRHRHIALIEKEVLFLNVENDRLESERKKLEARIQKLESGKAGDKKIKKWNVCLANEAISPIIKKYGKQPDKLTARFLEEQTGCPKSTLTKTRNWDALKRIKRMYKDEQGKMQHRPVKLSDKMLSIAEQTENGTVKLHTSHQKKDIEGDE